MPAHQSELKKEILLVQTCIAYFTLFRGPILECNILSQKSMLYAEGFNVYCIKKHVICQGLQSVLNQKAYYMPSTQSLLKRKAC